jgi:hypothetical protein
MTIDDLVESITDGDYDNDLETIFKAVFARAAEVDTEFAWKITLDGDEWDRETVTLAELAFAEKMTGVPYVQLNPVSSADHLSALIVAHNYRVKLLALDRAVAAAAKLTARDIADIVSVCEVKQAPKDGQPQPGNS